VVPQAIEDARDNARRNGIGNAKFFVGKAEEVLPQFYSMGDGIRSDRAGASAGDIKGKVGDTAGDMRHPDVIVVDPPRKGCDEECLRTMVSMAPERIVYVSCDSATLARDLKYLTANGYKLNKVRPVDMFPNTVHVEVVSLLQRVSNTRERTITLDVEMEDYHKIKNRTEVTADATE
jgi:23S rRNA (uracil1939-C5)-methyltransferase